MMLSPRSISAAMVAAAAAVALAAPAAPPRSIKELASEHRFTAQQRADIRGNAESWCAKIGSQKPEEVDEARARLFEPLRAVQVTQEFRFEYAQAALPCLVKVVGNGGPHTAVNAMQIVALLGTPQSLEIIVAHLSADDEKRMCVRLSAANGFAPAVRVGIIPENDVNKALRLLEKAAGREEDPWVLQRQFEAIASVDSAVSREIQVNVLRSVTSRMQKQGGPSNLMQATFPALILIRNKYIDLTGEEQKAMGKSLAPVLHDLCTVAQGHWERAQAEDSARISYGGAVNVSENLLKLIDTRVRPAQAGPRSEMWPAWSDRDKARFVNGHDAWGLVLAAPPYAGP